MKKAETIRKLSALANKYDKAGETKKADRIDRTIHDLMKDKAGVSVLKVAQELVREYSGPSHYNNPYIVEMRGIIAKALTAAGYDVVEEVDSLSVAHPEYTGALSVSIEKVGAN